MSPKELNHHMLTRLCDAAGMTVLINDSLGIMIKAVEKTIIATDGRPNVNDLVELRAAVVKSMEMYKSSAAFAMQLHDDMTKLKQLLNG